MSDERLRVLEREGRDAPPRSTARARWRTALLRLGRLREAGLEIGDRVWVEGEEGRVFDLTKTRVRVQIDIGPKLCVRPAYRLPARRSVRLLEPDDGTWRPWK
jgi:hypothetical protein